MSEKLSVGLREVEQEWSLNDAANAHDALDWFDAIDIDHQREMENARQRQW